MTHRLTLQAIEPVTHDVHRLGFPKPDGFDFTPGQATELSLDRDGWRDEGRPFTFTSLPHEDRLEFTIKSYPEHDGVTKRIGEMVPGDQVLIGDAWGAIEDKGPGTFIAGGAGVTPFIAVLRARLDRDGTLEGSSLIFANKRERDIILRGEFEAMQGLRTLWVLSDEEVEGLHHGQVDGDFLDAQLGDFSGIFYLCGPPPMEQAVGRALAARGVAGDRLVTEE